MFAKLSNDNSKKEEHPESTPPDKMETPPEHTPIEMSKGTVEPERRGIFKKLFINLGAVKTTEFSPEYLSAVKEFDDYKEMLCTLASKIMRTLQQNPVFVPEAESKMQFEAAPGDDPYEQLETALRAMNEFYSSHTQALQSCISICTELSKAHRHYQKRGRRAIHYMRTFLNVDYIELNDERQTLIDRRKDMDFAKYNFTDDPTDSNKQTYELALTRFRTQSEKVFNMLGTLPEKKERHRLELIKVLDEMRKFHEEASEMCAKASKARF